MTPRANTSQRAARHAALGDPARLAIVDELARSNRSPVELRRIVDMESNLLAHHLDVLERVGLIERSRSSGDGRRRYLHLLRDALDDLTIGQAMPIEPALFVCSANSARSQLAAALWRSFTGAPADSAGTEPADRVHPEAVAAARRAGLDLSAATPRQLTPDEVLPPIVVTVCDRAHEELRPPHRWMHWSVPDPVPAASPQAFDDVVVELRTRIAGIVGAAGIAS